MKRIINLFRSKRYPSISQKLKTRLDVESLGERINPVAGITRSPLGVVTIEGTIGNDSSTVSVTGQTVRVTLNNTSASFPTTKVRSLVFKGGNGNDDFTNNSSIPSTALGGNGDDRLTGGNATDVFFAGAGNDTMIGNSGNDSMLGEAGDDSMSGGSGNDTVDGGSGNDDLSGDDGNDIIRGGSGRDDLSGDDGNDSIDGGTEDDSIHGGNGNDLSRGGSGNDSISGDNGDDSLFGDAGDDSLNGGLGLDRVSGGVGADSSIDDSSDRSNDCERRHGSQQDDGLARVEGVIQSIVDNSVTIRTVSGVDVQVLIVANTILEKDGSHVPLSAFVVGERAEAKFNADTREAFKLEAGVDNDDDGGNQQGQARAEGTITAIGSDSISLTRQNGTVVTVSINASTKLERNDLHVSLSAFRLGDRGEFRFDPNTLVASKVEAVGA